MLATIPRSMTSRLRSARLKRDSGKPVSWGISHASALNATTTSGGRNPRGRSGRGLSSCLNLPDHFSIQSASRPLRAR